MKKIHNTTTAIDAAYAPLWLSEAREKYLPSLLSHPRVRQVSLIQVPYVTGMSEDVTTYTVQICFDTQEDLDAFLEEDYDSLQCVFSSHLKIYAHSFSLVLDVVEHHTK